MADPALTRLGEQQAARLAEFLAGELQAGPYDHDDFEVTRLFCSPMHRSLLTVEPIAEALDLTPEVWIDIHEHGGLFKFDPERECIVAHSGKTRQEILDIFPDYILPDEITDEGWWTESGSEDLPGCQARAIRVAAQLREWAVAETEEPALSQSVPVLGALRRGAAKLAGESNGPAPKEEQLMLITHGTFMSMLIKALFNMLPAKHVHYTHYNTAITRIDFSDDGRMAVHYMNRVDHLPPSMVS